MKRAADETTQIDETKAKIPKVKAFTASRAEWGVMHAKLDQGKKKLPSVIFVDSFLDS